VAKFDLNVTPTPTTTGAPTPTSTPTVGTTATPTNTTTPRQRDADRHTNRDSELDSEFDSESTATTERDPGAVFDSAADGIESHSDPGDDRAVTAAPAPVGGFVTLSKRNDSTSIQLTDLESGIVEITNSTTRPTLSIR